MRALIVGYGKMGRAIEAALLARGHQVVGTVDEGDRPGDFLEGRPEGGEGRSAAGDAAAGCVDVAFEFTTPAAAEALVVSLLSKKVPVVSGTTGWDIARALELSRRVGTPFLHSPNFSIGVAVMKRLAAQAAALLMPFPTFEPGIVERHHAAKKDAPSGTAKLLGAAVEAVRGGAVPVVALRQGGQPGEHALYFEGASESLEIVHRARSRDLFASGAVAAAEWLLAGRRPGPATFDDVLDSIAKERAS